MEPENSPYGIIQWYIAKMPHPNVDLYLCVYVNFIWGYACVIFLCMNGLVH